MQLLCKASGLLFERRQSEAAASDAIQPFLLAFPSDSASFRHDHLSSHGLRSLASADVERSVGNLSRDSLLTVANSTAKLRHSISWNIHSGTGAHPSRTFGGISSYGGSLYMYGSMPTYMFVTEDLSKPYYTDCDQYMLKLHPDTCTWGPASCICAPEQRWTARQSLSKGVVHGDQFFLVGTNGPDGHDGMRTYDLTKQAWASLDLPEVPPASINVLLGTYQNQLIQFGGEVKYGDSVEPVDALWTFHTEKRIWQHRQSSGCMPDPALSHGLAVVGKNAFVLVDQYDSNGNPGSFLSGHRMEMYVLDLNSWHWTKQPSQDAAPWCASEIQPTVVQGHWLVFGGMPAQKSIKFTGRSCELFDFDFSTLTWSKATLTGDLLQPRASFLATCHKGAMVVMGGVQNPTAEADRQGFSLRAAETVQTVWPQYLPNSAHLSDTSCMRYELAASLRTMAKQRRMTDLTVEVDGQRWKVHRLILASCSPMFEDFVECGLFPGQPLILTGLSPDTMDIIVDWLYADFRETVTFAQRVDLYQASHKFNIPELEAECVRVLASSVSVDTYPAVMSLAAEHGCQELEQACQAFISKLQEAEGTVAAKGLWLNHPQLEPTTPSPSAKAPQHDSSSSDNSSSAPSSGSWSSSSAAKATCSAATAAGCKKCVSHPLDVTSHPLEIKSHAVDISSFPVDVDSEDEDDCFDEGVMDQDVQSHTGTSDGVALEHSSLSHNGDPSSSPQESNSEPSSTTAATDVSSPSPVSAISETDSGGDNREAAFLVDETGADFEADVQTVLEAPETVADFEADAHAAPENAEARGGLEADVMAGDAEEEADTVQPINRGRGQGGRRWGGLGGLLRGVVKGAAVVGVGLAGTALINALAGSSSSRSSRTRLTAQ